MKLLLVTAVTTAVIVLSGFQLQAQALHVGIGGILVRHTSATFHAAPFVPATISDSVTYHRPSVGGGYSVEAELGRRFIVQIDGLYTSTHFDRTFSFRLNGDSSGLTFTDTTAAHVRSWMWPLTVRYQFSSMKLRPYVGGGLNVSEHVKYEAQTVTVDNRNGSGTSSASFTLKGASRPWLLVSGIRIPYKSILITPEIRYLHWPDPNQEDVLIARQNQVSLNVGFFYRLP